MLFGAVGLTYRLTRHVWYVSAANLSFRRDAWSGYDVRLTQGGDELDLLRRLRRAGRVRFDPTLLVDSSARRLNRGFWYNAVVTFGYYYLLGYLLNRLTRRAILPMAPEIRTSQFRWRRPRLPAVAILTAVLTVAVGLAMLLSPVGAAVNDGMQDGLHTVAARFGHR